MAKMQRNLTKRSRRNSRRTMRGGQDTVAGTAPPAPAPAPAPVASAPDNEPKSSGWLGWLFPVGNGVSVGKGGRRSRRKKSAKK